MEKRFQYYSVLSGVGWCVPFRGYRAVFDHTSSVLLLCASYMLLQAPPKPAHHPIHGRIKGRRLENVLPAGTYPKWRSDFVYRIYTMPQEGKPSNGFHLQELCKVRCAWCGVCMCVCTVRLPPRLEALHLNEVECVRCDEFRWICRLLCISMSALC
jgi:hypothetical protein